MNRDTRNASLEGRLQRPRLPSDLLPLLVSPLDRHVATYLAISQVPESADSLNVDKVGGVTPRLNR